MVSLLTNCNDSVFEQKMAWWVTWYEFLGWCITTSHWRDLKTFKSKNLRAHLTKLHISTQSLRKPDLEMGESLFSHLNYCHKVSHEIFTEIFHDTSIEIQKHELHALYDVWCHLVIFGLEFGTCMTSATVYIPTEAWKSSIFLCPFVQI